MFINLRLRSQASIESVKGLLAECVFSNDMALVQRPQTTLDNYHSTASAPSLRSREPVAPMEMLASPDLDGGNVKVVVRVRKFVQRGWRQTPSARA